MDGIKNYERIQRNSGVELLRIVCIIGIIGLHLWDDVLYSEYKLTELNQLFRGFHYSAFGCANTCFVLITGYFGTKCNISKIVCLDFAARFYDVAFFAIALVLGTAFSLKSGILVLFPFFTKHHWFVSVYIALLIISPFLNWIAEHIEGKKLLSIIITMIALCWTLSFFPEFSSVADGGNGIAYFSVIYLLGRYIKLYANTDRSRKIYGLTAMGAFLIIFVGNILLSLLAGKTITWLSVNNPFPILLAVSLLIFATKSKFESKLINSIAKNVLGVYLSENGIRTLLFPLVFNIEKHASGNDFVLYFIFECVSIFIVAVLIELIRRVTIAKIDCWIGKKIEKIVIGFGQKIQSVNFTEEK